MIRVALSLSVMLAASSAVAFQLPWQGGAEEDAPPRPPRPVVSVVVQDLPSERRSFPGVVMAGREVQLGFRTLGRLSARPVDIGDPVRTGDVLAELTPDDLQDNVRAARAAVDAAEVTLETARLTAARTRDLAARDVAPQAQLEQAERALKSAEAGLAQARSELAQSEDAEGFARLVAPFDGVVSQVLENPGAVVAAGAPVVTLSETATREAVIDLPDAVLAALPLDTEVSIWLESDPATRTGGEISRVEPLADAATRTRRVHLKMDDPDGFRLNALIRAQRADDPGSVLTLPITAIAKGTDGPFVWVVRREGDTASVARQPVELGISMDGIAQVTAGLQVGQEIVVRGVNSLREGQQVGRQVDP